MDFKNKDYYLGLDIGTNSVGWAVTDEEYNILEYRRKAMWGIHLFDEGQTAAERRTHRCARRRANRRKQRIVLLRELFDKEICKIDPAFFERLDESGLHECDRKDKQMNSLFNDSDFKDTDYHNRFPTIYHLRKFLMETNECPDLRLVYLAIHHILKYRGHFLFANVDSGMLPEFEPEFESLMDSMESLGFDVSCSTPCDVKEVLADRSTGVNDRRDLLKQLLSCGDKPSENIAGLLAGRKTKMSDIFGDELPEDVGKFQVDFKSSDVDDKIAELEELLDSDQWQLIRRCKQVYDWGVLSSLLGRYNSISHAMVAKYDEHEADLKLLKEAVRDFVPSKYFEVFKSPSVKGNYCSYSGVCDKAKPKKYCNQEEFCKYIRGILPSSVKDDARYSDLVKKSEENKLLPKQRTSENSILPYSVHKSELEAILDNVSRFYPWMTTTMDDGFTVRDKVLMIQTFRIPYYVGPLYESSPRAWVVRGKEHITPWNFDKVVDHDACAEKFIENLTSMCTYMIGEKVLPKNSILYSRFMLYNELNNIRVNGDKLSVNVKKRMVKDLFVDRTTKVSKKTIREWLESINQVDPKESVEITGIDNTVKAQLRSEHVLRRILGDKADNRQLCEDIIHTITVFGEPKRIKSKLSYDHKDVLTKEEINALSKQTFSDWGNLSRKFLTGLYVKNRETGLDSNIMMLLEDTDCNLMEILSKYKFQDQIDKHNDSLTVDEGITIKTLDSMYISPAVRRGVWRTIRIINDIVKIIGKPPKKVFVETTRTDMEDKKRTESRKDQLVQLYKSCKEDPAWIENLDKRSDVELKSRSLYLYYTQLGRCMYCGSRIDPEDLNNTNAVDRDHIYPRSQTKDDSIHNNLVLTCKTCNSLKSNTYPLSPEIQVKMGKMWRELKDKGYIRPEKYARLTRTTPFTEDEACKFINRQLVETSQSAKAVIQLMKRVFKDESEVVFVKANLVSEFRRDHSKLYPQFVKCRSVNDFHHAKDAYLNIVVGNVHDVKFTKDYHNFLRSNEHWNLARMYDYDVVRNGNVAWKPGLDGTIKTVAKHMRRDNILFTRYSYVGHGKMFDDNVITANGTLFPKKKGLDPTIYGGYNKLRIAAYSLIEYTSKGKKVRALAPIPIYMLDKMNDEVVMQAYFTQDVGCEVSILKRIIRLKSLLECNGVRVYMGGKSDNRISIEPAVQLLIPDEQYGYCKRLFELAEDSKNRINRSIIYYGLTMEQNIKLYDCFIEKSKSNIYFKNEELSMTHNNLVKYRSLFETKDVHTQAMILNDILPIFQCNPTLGSLSKLGGVNKLGRTRINLTIGCDMWLINQSPTGLIESREKLSL